MARAKVIAVGVVLALACNAWTRGAAADQSTTAVSDSGCVAIGGSWVDCKKTYNIVMQVQPTSRTIGRELDRKLAQIRNQVAQLSKDQQTSDEWLLAIVRKQAEAHREEIIALDHRLAEAEQKGEKASKSDEELLEKLFGIDQVIDELARQTKDHEERLAAIEEERKRRKRRLALGLGIGLPLAVALGLVLGFTLRRQEEPAEGDIGGSENALVVRW
jgi:hypothetical protein